MDRLLKKFWCNGLKTRTSNRVSIFRSSLVTCITADETHKGENSHFLLLLLVGFSFEIGGHNNHISISAYQALNYSSEIRLLNCTRRWRRRGQQWKWDSPLQSKGYYEF